MYVVSSESSSVLWQALSIVERSVFPRAVTFKTVRGRLDLDVSGQCALVCPRANGAFVVDEQFRQEAPQAYEAVSQRTLFQGAPRQGRPTWSGQSSQGPASSEDVNKAVAVLATHREALLRLWGRALAGLCSDVLRIETTVEAAPFQMNLDAEARRRLGFSALELLSAVSPHVSAKADSQVLAFYTAQKQTAPDSWLFHLAGWPAAFPGEVAELGRITEMGAAAKTVQAWRNNLADISGPIMSVMMGPQQDAFRCVAVDDAYVALVTRPSAEIGAALAAWRSAQQGRTAMRTQV